MSDNHPHSVRIGQDSEDGKTGATVLPSGIEPASPVLQTGAITRSASRAKSWPGIAGLPAISCPATGIVDYLVVKDHPRPSPGCCRGSLELRSRLALRVDLSRSWRPALFAEAADVGPEMKKAAEVDFTWAACARTYKTRRSSYRPPGEGCLARESGTSAYL